MLVLLNALISFAYLQALENSTYAEVTQFDVKQPWIYGVLSQRCVIVNVKLHSLMIGWMRTTRSS